MIYLPDQAQGLTQDIQRCVMISILPELILGTFGVLTEKHPISSLHRFPLPPATMTGLCGRKEAIYLDHLSATLLDLARQHAEQFA